MLRDRVAAKIQILQGPFHQKETIRKRLNLVAAQSHDMGLAFYERRRQRCQTAAIERVRPHVLESIETVRDPCDRVASQLQYAETFDTERLRREFSEPVMGEIKIVQISQLTYPIWKRIDITIPYRERRYIDEDSHRIRETVHELITYYGVRYITSIRHELRI